MTADCPSVGDQITTAEQLDALPSLTIVVDANEEVQQRHGHLTTQDGDYSAWLGVMPLTCKPSPEVALPATVLYVPGEPSRPSVTDNARDEEPLAWCPGCGGRILARVVRERGVCSDCWGTRDDPWAAGRAETTTATNEDAAQVIERAAEVLVRDLTYSTGWDAEANDAIALHQAQALADAGLLATAPTDTTKEN